MHELNNTEWRKGYLHCPDHVDTQERIARIETMLEVHNKGLSRMEELGAAQSETLKEISLCTAKLSKQLDAMVARMTGFEERWNRQSVEADMVISEYRQAMIAINKRFEDGDKRMDMLEEINNNFAWFRNMVNKGRTKLVEGFIFMVLVAIMLTVTMQWQDVSDRLWKMIGK